VAAVPGINRFSQDTAACLLAGGRLVAVAGEVRFNPRAAPKAFRASAIAFCWQSASCRPRSAIPARTWPTAASARCCATPGVRLNLDLVRQVERLGRQPPGREIGLRLNPRAGAFSERTRSAARYPGPDRPAKSGIDALPGQLGRTPLLRGSSRLRADRPARRRTAVPDHHRAGRTRLDRDRDQPSVQVNGAACSATSGWSRNR
jgi:hypothetical protein